MTIQYHPEWFAPITPYDYQVDIYHKTIAHIKSGTAHLEPAFLHCSVSAGKSLMMAMITKHAQMMADEVGKKQMSILCLARTGDLVEQNSEEMWGLQSRNSVFSASLNTKSTHYPVIVGSEKSVKNALDKELAIDSEGNGYRPSILLIDECQEVPYDRPDSDYMVIINTMRERNPKLIVIGYSGSPYRGLNSIIGEFWKKELYKIDMFDLMKMGKVHSLVYGFGHDDTRYDFSPIDAELKKDICEGDEDYTEAQMQAMNEIIGSNPQTTHLIVRELVELMKTRNCALITCAGVDHINQAIEALPDYRHHSEHATYEGALYAVVTQSTKTDERREIKRLCNSGRIKMVFQIGAWAVGVNVPAFDTIVFMRRIKSLVKLIQLIGRGIRLLKKEHFDIGMFKDHCLVVDYTDTMETMAEILQDPILEQAQEAKAKKEHGIIECPKCFSPNSAKARRCIGEDDSEPDGRCGFFWSSMRCPECDTENDKCARNCRKCGHLLKDPNKNLSGKHYNEADYKPVLSRKVTMTKNQKGIVINYQLPGDEIATEIFYPQHDKPFMRENWRRFIIRHVPTAWRGNFIGKPATTCIKMAAQISTPAEITHRVNDEGYSIITHRRFSTGKEEITA